MSRAPRMLALGAIVVVGGVVGGCASSPPTQFYTLEPVPPPQRIPSRPRSPLRVAAVHIPPLLDRDQIVRERAPGELEVSEVHRWGAPLSGMLRDVLTQDLALRLPAGSVLLPQQPAPALAASITVDVLSLEARGDHISFEGAWSLVPANSEVPSLNRTVHLREPANAQDYAAQVHAMSVALGHLADAMAGALSQP